MKRKWTEALVREAAVTHDTKRSFQMNCGGGYDAAVRLGILNELFSNRYRAWDERCIRKEARNYSSKKAFQKGCVGAYTAALRLGILDALFKNQRRYWDAASIRRVASNYTTKKDFSRGEQTAYSAALRLGIIDDLGFEHRDGKDNDAVYIWRAVGQYFNGEPVYKIGLTSARLNGFRVKEGARKSGFDHVLICCEKVTCPARDLEKRLHLLGHDPKFVGFDGCTEFRAMSDTVLWAALGLISEVTVRKP